MTTAKTDKSQNVTPWSRQPEFTNQIVRYFSAGEAHCFILHLNVADTVVPGKNLQQYLDLAFPSRLLVHYDRSSGVEFATPDMEERAKRIMKNAKGGAAATSRAAGVLAAMSRAQGSLPRGEPADYEFPQEPLDALRAIETLMTTPENTESPNPRPAKCLVTINYADLLVPDANKPQMSGDDRNILLTLIKWGSSKKLSEEPGQIIILVTRNLSDLHVDLRAASSRYLPLEIPIPNMEVRLDYVNWYMAEDKRQADDLQASGATKVKRVVLDEGVDARSIASLTAGLGLAAIRNLFLDAKYGGPLKLGTVIARKREILSSEYADSIETYEGKMRFDRIGGHTKPKEYFRKRIIRPILAGDYDMVPQGVLLTGPAGTGKTVFAQALANEANVNFLNFRLAKIVSQWQGGGERALERSISAFVSMAPTFVFMDEVDQIMRRGTGNSGGSQQDNRIFSRMLEVMSDTTLRGKVLFIGATNRPDLLDAAFKRPGRMDIKFPFLPPEPEEREEIFRIAAFEHLKAEGFQASPDLIDRTDGWTGAEIMSAAIEARYALYDGLETTPEGAFKRAICTLKRSTQDVEFMTLAAIRECNNSDMLPARYRDLDAKDISVRMARNENALGTEREI